MKLKYRCFKAQLRQAANNLLTMEFTRLDKRGYDLLLTLEISPQGQVLQYQTSPPISVRTLFNLNYYLYDGSRLIVQGEDIKDVFKSVLAYYFGDAQRAVSFGLDNLSWLLMLNHPELGRLLEYHNDPLTFKLLCSYCSVRFPDTGLWELKRPALLDFQFKYLHHQLTARWTAEANRQLSPIPPLSKSQYRQLQKLTGFDIADAKACIQSIQLFMQFYANERLQKFIRHQTIIEFQSLKYAQYALNMNHVKGLNLSFEQLSLLGKERFNAGYFDDIRQMQMLLGVVFDIRKLKTARAIIQHHNRLVSQLQQQAAIEQAQQQSAEQAWDNIAFPPAPLAGNEYIKPMLCRAQLRVESEQMRHCIGLVNSYTRHALEGKMAFYRVLYPERATLAVEVKANGDIAINELVRIENKKVKHSTRTYIEKWLESAGKQRVS